MRVLALFADRQQGRALGERFYARFGDKLDMHVLPDAFSATEKLERFTPDLIICAAKVGKMKGLDFHAFIRRDPKFQQAAFILLDSDAKDKLASPLSAALHTYAPPEEVLRAAFKLMLSNGKLRDTRHDSREHTPVNTPLRASGRPDMTSSAKASGSFEVLTLFDLVTSLTQKKNSGTLLLRLGLTNATLVFDAGQLVHARFGSASGEAALISSFLAAESDPDASYEFVKDSPPLPEEAYTLHAPVQELLLTVAVKLDHHRLGEPELS